MTRTVLRNGWILDGSGNPWFRSDLAISGEKITAVGAVEPLEGDTVLDVQGQIVCPGFIDIHTHSDIAYLVDKYAASKLCQGVTTEVVGNCGKSCAPIRGPGGEAFTRVNDRLLQGNPVVETMDGYLNQLEENGLPLNIVGMVGHSTLRASVMGYATRPPTADEQAEMNRLLAESLDAGAFGMTMGYQPGDSADVDELVELGRVIAAHGGFLADHSAELNLKWGRPEDSTTYESATRMIRRLLTVGERAHVPVQISHAKAISPELWGRACWVTSLIDGARSRGVDAACDLYGYVVSGGSLVGLFAPQFLLEKADAEDIPGSIKEAVGDRRMRERVLQFIRFLFDTLGGPGRVRIAAFPAEPEVEGTTFGDVSQAKDQPADEVALDFLQRGDARLRCEILVEKDVIHLMQHPTAMICSDARGMAIDGPEDREMVHPRTLGAFPRILRRYVIELGAMGFPEAVRKMTSAPAQRIGLTKRGRIAEGYYADVVVFDPHEVADLATHEDPYRPPRGIRYVFVNGSLAMREGEFQRRLAGHALRKG